eukprot:9146967-Pyramimonas_sp.AAC.1
MATPTPGRARARPPSTTRRQAAIGGSASQVGAARRRHGIGIANTVGPPAKRPLPAVLAFPVVRGLISKAFLAPQ